MIIMYVLKWNNFFVLWIYFYCHSEFNPFVNKMEINFCLYFLKIYSNLEYWDQNSGVMTSSYSTADWLYLIDSNFEFAFSNSDF